MQAEIYIQNITLAVLTNLLRINKSVGCISDNALVTSNNKFVHFLSSPLVQLSNVVLVFKSADETSQVLSFK